MFLIIKIILKYKLIKISQNRGMIEKVKIIRFELLSIIQLFN